MNQEYHLKRWSVIIVASLLVFYAYFNLFLIGGASHALAVRFGVEPSQLKLLENGCFLAALVFMLPAGILIDYLPVKITIHSCMIISLANIWFFAHGNTLTLLLISRLIDGFCIAFFVVGTLRLVLRWIAMKYLPLVISVIMVFGMLGGIVAQSPFDFLIAHLGFAKAMGVVALLAGIILILFLIFVAEKPPYYNEFQAKYFPKLSFAQSIKSTFLVPQNWLIGFYAGCMNLPLFVLGGLWGEVYFSSALHMTMMRSSEVISVIFLGAMLGMVFFGWLSSRSAPRRKPMMIAVILALVVVPIILLAGKSSFVLSSLLFFIFGFISGVQIIAYPLILELNETFLAGSAVSVILFCLFGLSLLVEPFFSFLMDGSWHGIFEAQKPVLQLMNFHHAMAIFYVVFGLAFLISCFLPETFGKRRRI